ncbi:MAG: nucleotide exchange factor GrpE [Porticoccaceae bacterium]|nr:nucleotide exchange factor GrpE [Porticoccaceae bacterium]MDG1308226.1 nucleotide exchange factor GrpE [Porticoccaceae bacterium]
MSEETNKDDKTAVNDDQVAPQDDKKAALDELNADIEAELVDQMDQEPGQSETEQLQQQVASAKDQVLRVQAEMQNLRRRAERDVENAHKYALDKFAPELLPVVDNLERALAAIDSEDAGQKAVAEGIELTLKTFVDVLLRYKVEAVDPAGQPFDAELHQAVSMVPNADIEPNTVMDVFQKGYTLNGRLLRPAMVVVSKPA